MTVCSLSPRSQGRRSQARSGLALIAVLVALSLLLALTAPFLLSMGHGDQYSRAIADEKQVELLSASARDLLLAEAERGSFATDESPLADGRDEYPSGLELGEAFAPLERAGRGRNALQGEVWDLQRKIDVNTASPLLLANLLGLSARLQDEHEPDVDELRIEGAIDDFPERGLLLVDREVIRYAERDGNTFRGLGRGALTELGFQPATDHTLAEGELVLDFRTVLAAMYPVLRDGDPTTRQPFGSVREVARIEMLGVEGFLPEELDVLERHCTAATIRENSTAWGRPERVFAIDYSEETQDMRLLVRSAATLGGGAVVRVRSTDGELQEYGFVFATQMRGGGTTVNLPSRNFLRLMTPLTLPFEPLETIVEPLVPVPVNVNTADREVLAAVVAQIRVRPGTRASGAHDAAPTAPPPYVSRRGAEDIATDLIALRGSDDSGEGPVADASGLAADPTIERRPFDGWEDFARRWVRPVLDAAQGRQRKAMWMLLYENLRLGRPSGADFGTAPIGFHSSPLVGYRASAARYRASGGEAARLERQGVAIALPGQSLYWGAATQEQIEEMIRLDRRSPFWQTFPINTSAVIANDLGTVPAPRTPSQLLAWVAPDAGFGQPRFPDREGGEGAIRAQPSTTPFNANPRNSYRHESFMHARHPEGRDLAQEGSYAAGNSGPRAGGVETARGFDHSKIRFPLTAQGGLTSRHAVSFWFKLESLEPQALYELAAGSGPDRNEISLAIRDGMLVFEVFDEAGLDPEPAQSRAGVERTAGTWEVPIEEYGIEADEWYHVSLSALGNRPGQLTMLFDGVPRGEPKGRTYLTAPIESYEFDVNAANRFDDQDRFRVRILVEDTDGFPDQGVLRIGRELFEYSVRDSAGFSCRYIDSVGGRGARDRLDEVGVPREELEELEFPDHPVGAAVELYGYSIPVYPQRPLQPASANLPESLGAFSIARVINDSNTRPIIIQTSNFQIPVGKGLDETFAADLDLGDPVATQAFPPGAAQDRIAAGFPQGGGYALLVQRRMRWELETNNNSELSTPAEIGGVEVIRYGARQGSRLTGIQRAVPLPMNLQEDRDGVFTRAAKNFITEWESWVRIRVDGELVWVQELPLYQLYVVPISIPFAGVVKQDSELVEWVQLMQPGSDENDTEWVRYNAVVDGRHLVRAYQPAWDQVRRRLTQQTGIDVRRVPVGGGEILGDAQRDPYPAPFDDGLVRIGYIDPIEIEFPAINAARRALGFRGDPFTKTTSHAHAANTLMLPVHRLEYSPHDRPGAGRAGRGDRVALVQGTKRAGGGEAAVEWHTVNWTLRYRWGELDNDDEDARRNRANEDLEHLGDWAFQLVGLKAQLRNAFIGADDVSTTELRDVRMIDRMVKFPSGELPAADVEDALFGASLDGELPAARGIIDEIAYVARMALPRQINQVGGIDDRAREFNVHPRRVLTPAGTLVDRKPKEWTDWGAREVFPEDGGLLMIDGEILAYENYDRSTGEVQIASDGRGLLGTTARAHDHGAIVMFLEQVPTAILASGVNENDPELEVQNLGGLPRHGGTVLVGRELLHYTWTRGNTTLAMPRWTDPESADGRAERGLFRGRYGTAPQAASAGQPVIWFPFRYWDRFRPRADDPEMACFQATLQQGPVWFESLGWREEEQDPLVDVHCYVRVDGRGEFSDDPDTTDGLYLFTDGEPNDRTNPIGAAGSRLEMRFVTVYRNGAFDPDQFLMRSWKRAPTIKWFLLTYEGDGRILSERITAR